MVFHHQIEQRGGLLLYRRIKLFATKGLVYLTDAALERLVLLIGKEGAAAELRLQPIDRLHGIFVGGMEGFFGGGLVERKLLEIVVVEGVEGIDIVANHGQQTVSLLGGYRLLQLISS